VRAAKVSARQVWHARWVTLNDIETDDVRVRTAASEDIPGIVAVSKTSILPGEDAGFGGGLGSPFDDPATLASAWEEPNVVRGEEVFARDQKDV
jgi:hypothetical protein